MQNDDVLRQFVDDPKHIESFTVVIGRDHVVVHHHGDAPGLQPLIQLDVEVEEGLGSGLAVKQLVERLVPFA